MRKRTVFGITMLLLVLLMSLMPVAKAATNYWWDNIYFVEGQPIKYPHPDRDYYGISPYITQYIDGASLKHFQVDAATTVTAIVSVSALCALVGSLCNGWVGYIVGYGLGTFIDIVSPLMIDEYSCLWVWISHAFIDWVNYNSYALWYYGTTYPQIAINAIVQALFTIGYIRVGPWTFVDGLGMGDPTPQPPPPPPQHYWVSSIYTYSWYGSSASVGSPENLIGSENDGQYGYVYAGNYLDQAMIVGTMNADAHGHIELYGYSAPGYYSNLLVYVSYDYQNWYQVTSQRVNPGSAHWIDCGSYSGNFRYIAIVTYNYNGYSGRIYIDSVKVTP